MDEASWHLDTMDRQTKPQMQLLARLPRPIQRWHQSHHRSQESALIDSDAVQRKRAAAEHWCKQRGMQYQIATIYQGRRGC